jgi:hypothetical protein
MKMLQKVLLHLPTVSLEKYISDVEINTKTCNKFQHSAWRVASVQLWVSVMPNVISPLARRESCRELMVETSHLTSGRLSYAVSYINFGHYLVAVQCLICYIIHYNKILLV